MRTANRRLEPDWHNAPVGTFGKPESRLLIVGLAPGLRGANRTGRPFTGDYAGDLLYNTLLAYGFAEGSYEARADDGLRLNGCAITNSVRCVPPQNKPTPQEISACRSFLRATIESLPALEVIVALGRVAHESVVRALGMKAAAFLFAHGAEHVLSGSGPNPQRANLALFDSYHCSRYNTNTGVLTPQMFRAVFASVRKRLDC
jgi:uracil-DNA glycosylase family 4